jgi:hypothetical protein
MTQGLGETRDSMALDCWNKAEAIANERKYDVKPFYIVFAAKPDPHLSGAMVNGQFASGGIRQTFKITYDRPKLILGQLVWFVDNPMGIFQFVPELSTPYDVPLIPALMSDRKEDQAPSVMEKGKQMNVLLS